jgi:gluconate 2-dehydrogenase gamma chain
VNQAALVQAVADQIVPADQDPGGKDAGVLFFVDQLLAGPFGTFYKERYTTGLRMIDNASRKQFGGNFASLKFEQQTALLKEFESGKAAGADGQAFFSLIRLHSMEGYYGDPAHGGNRNKASWKMINFEG